MTHRLSKTRFLDGLQCHKLLWWKTHERDAPELSVDPQLQLVFDQGTEVGGRACGEFPGGVLIDLPHWEAEARVHATREAMVAGAPAVFEATFVEEDVFVAVDILARTDGGGWRLIEVKSSLDLKEVHIPDAAVQTWVLERAGVQVESVELMHLNRACVFPDLSDLFVSEGITAEVQDFLPRVPSLIHEQKNVLTGGLPVVPTGSHCRAPYECPFQGRCWTPEPSDSVARLYHGGARKDRLRAMDVRKLGEIPVDFDLSSVQERQRRAARTGELVVEEGLRAALEELAGEPQGSDVGFQASGTDSDGLGLEPAPASPSPLAFLDFETVAPFIPRWEGCRPFTAVPVQFSCHFREVDGTERHEEWLHNGPEDPRPACAHRLLDLLEDVPVILAYNAPFEMRCIRGLADAVPGLAAPLTALADRIKDLLPVVREHIYHLDFQGSFSLKAVLPALVPDLTYEGLEIKDGGEASAWLFRLLLHPESIEANRVDRLRSDLLAYCRLDTLALVRLLGRLEELAGV